MVICSVRPCRVKQRVRKFAHPCGYKREYRFSQLVSWPTVKEKAQRLCKCATLVKAGDLARIIQPIDPLVAQTSVLA